MNMAKYRLIYQELNETHYIMGFIEAVLLGSVFSLNNNCTLQRKVLKQYVNCGTTEERGWKI